MKTLLSTACMAMTFFASSCVTDPEAHTRLEVGDLIPSFSVTLSTGEIVSTASMRGKVAVIEFFNTGCADCRQSLPVLQEAYDSIKDDPDVMFLCIAREEETNHIDEYWKAHSLSLPWSPQSGREVYSLFATEGIPRLYIVGRDGRLNAQFGPDDQPDVSTLISILRPTLL